MDPIVTLTTDFGTRDPYVGALSGAVLAACPSARLVTISHDVPPHDILRGAHVLACAAPLFPPGSVHVAVVDPGVGTERRALVAVTPRHVYVAPDNGLLTGVFEREPEAVCYSIERLLLGRPRIHPTFHGRDLFGPVAGRLARGLDPAEVGPCIENPVRAYPRPTALVDGGGIEASVVAIDNFGNVTTNITASELTSAVPEPDWTRLGLGDASAPLAWHETYGQAEPGELFLLWGSSGQLELSLPGEPASERTGASEGDRIVLRVCGRRS